MIITIANLRFELRQPCKKSQTFNTWVGKTANFAILAIFCKRTKIANFAAACKPGHNCVKFRAIWIPTVN